MTIKNIERNKLNLNKIDLKKVILGLNLLLVLVFGLFVTPISAASNYQVALVKGTDYYFVQNYDTDGWNSTFTSEFSPSNWFDGESNITGAERKVTTKGISVLRSEATYDIFSSIFFSGSKMTTLLSLSQYGYNETEINEIYSNNYLTWYGVQAEWYFTTEGFKETPNQSSNVLIILKNPEEYKEILDNYNDFVFRLKNDTAVPPLISGSLNNYTADEFIKLIAFNGLTLANPFSQYLSSMIETLNCINTSYSFNSRGNIRLIMEGHSKTNFTIEITYTNQGSIGKVNIRNASNTEIYKITSYDVDWIFFTILFITIGIALGIVTILIYRRIKSKR